MEKETSCKISIRGKGAHKGKAMKGPQPGDDEELHVLIVGESQDNVDKATKAIEDIINPGNEAVLEEHKTKQLRELATINGTTLPDAKCRTCGEMGHRMYECPARNTSWKAPEVLCAICGESTHLTIDCKATPGKENKMRDEYNTFMSELLGAPNEASEADAAAGWSGGSGDSASASAASRPASANTPQPPPGFTLPPQPYYSPYQANYFAFPQMPPPGLSNSQVPSSYAYPFSYPYFPAVPTPAPVASTPKAPSVPATAPGEDEPAASSSQRPNSSVSSSPVASAPSANSIYAVTPTPSSTARPPSAGNSAQDPAYAAAYAQWMAVYQAQFAAYGLIEKLTLIGLL
jgi:hypothetical protein